MPKEWKKRLEEQPAETQDAKPDINPFETDVFAAELGHAPTLDLHGENIHDALWLLDRFIHLESAHSTPAIRIIHGKGEGKLQRAVTEWLTKQKSFVPYFRPSHRTDEQGAVIYAAVLPAKIKK